MSQEGSAHRGRAKRRKRPLWQGFVQGSLGAMTGATVSHPLDLIKVRMQIQGELAVALNPNIKIPAQHLGMGRMAASILSTDGVPGLFKGVTASLFRQLLYSGSRFGIYDVISSEVKEKLGCDNLPLYAKVSASMVAGGLGAFLANPGDVAMVRMQADGKRPAVERRNYRHIFDAIRRIVAEEGPFCLWRGARPTIGRAMIVTVGHLAAYDEVKQRMLTTKYFDDTIPTHFAASFCAAFVASVLSHPVDVAKTRLMNMSKGEYRGMFDCLVKTIEHEGPLALYKGFVPTLVRQMPYVIVTWLTVEQIKKAFRG